MTLEQVYREVSESLAKLKSLSEECYGMSTGRDLPFEQRSAAKVCHNRLNVAVFELGRCEEILHDIDFGEVQGKLF